MDIFAPTSNLEEGSVLPTELLGIDVEGPGKDEQIVHR